MLELAREGAHRLFALQRSALEESA